MKPSGKNCGKSSLKECDNMALYFECRINKNALSRLFFGDLTYSFQYKASLVSTMSNRTIVGLWQQFCRVWWSRWSIRSPYFRTNPQLVHESRVNSSWSRLFFQQPIVPRHQDLLPLPWVLFLPQSKIRSRLVHFQVSVQISP